MPSRKLIEAMSFFASASVLVEGVGSKEESRKVNVNAFHSSATSLSVISFVQLQLIQCKLASNLCTLCTFYYTLQSRPLQYIRYTLRWYDEKRKDWKDNVHNDYDILQVGNCFKGRVSHFFYSCIVLLGIIYDGKIVKMGRSDRKMVKDKKN